MNHNSSLSQCFPAAALALLAIAIAAVEADAHKFTTDATAETQSRRGDLPLVAQGALSAAIGREDSAYASLTAPP
jgi:hypothetical protein